MPFDPLPDDGRKSEPIYQHRYPGGENKPARSGETYADRIVNKLESRLTGGREVVQGMRNVKQPPSSPKAKTFWQALKPSKPVKAKTASKKISQGGTYMFTAADKMHLAKYAALEMGIDAPALVKQALGLEDIGNYAEEYGETVGNMLKDVGGRALDYGMAAPQRQAAATLMGRIPGAAAQFGQDMAASAAPMVNRLSRMGQSVSDMFGGPQFAEGIGDTMRSAAGVVPQAISESLPAQLQQMGIQGWDQMDPDQQNRLVAAGVGGAGLGGMALMANRARRAQQALAAAQAAAAAQKGMGFGKVLSGLGRLARLSRGRV